MDNIYSQLLNHLTPKDLLSLYLTNKEIQTAYDKKEAIDLLYQKYGITGHSFTSWYKNYMLKKIDPQLNYLYALEKTRYIDHQVNENHLFVLFDFLLDVTRSLKLSFKTFCYGCTLFYIFSSHYDIKVNELQMYGCISIYYASSLFEYYTPSKNDWVYFSDGAFSLEDFKQAKIIFFNTLHGQLIYPSPILFLSQTKDKTFAPLDNTLNLVLLMSFMPSIMVYKPSLIALTCQYMMTGQYIIYNV